MRVMVLAKSTPATELVASHRSGGEAMARFTEDLVHAGVLLAADALRPSSTGARVRFDGAARVVTDGPFRESPELVAGYWIWQVRSLDEAIEWLKRAPFPDGSELEIRAVAEGDPSDTPNPSRITTREEPAR